ncbi:MAG TPA: VOC family protein [Kiritimatiellia bacterium]|nr:VOC family protein [Kiritimatiellia bacterium]
MKIEHIAIWSPDIEALRRFYCTHFGCVSGAQYRNPHTGFSSYFLSFTQGARIEVMQKQGIDFRPPPECFGIAHFALSVGSEEAVRSFTNKLRKDGIPIVGEPRWTGDGCFESVVADPDGNLIEITI